MPVTIRDVQINPDNSGDGTAYTGYFSGYIERVAIGISNVDATTDLTVTDDSTGETILSLSNITANGNYGVRAQGESSADAALTGAYFPIRVTDSRAKCVIAQAGSSGFVQVHLYVADEEPLI